MPGHAEPGACWRTIQLLKDLAPARGAADDALVTKHWIKVIDIVSEDSELRRLVLHHDVEHGALDKAFRRLRVALAPKPPARTTLNGWDFEEPFYKDLHKIQTAWNAPFVGEVGEIFHAIVGQAAKFEDDYDAKVMSVVQSSGAGKSRLIDRYGINNLGVIFTFRTGFQSDYPPGDPEILRLLHGTFSPYSESKISTEHAIAVGLLGSVFRELHKRLDAIPKENVKTFSQTFHDQMAPLGVEPDDDPSESWSKYISATRSEERKKFCEAVSSATIATTTKLSEDTEWLDIFSYVDDSGSRVEKYLFHIPFYELRNNAMVNAELLRPAETLVAALEEANVTKATDPLQLFIALDGVSNLADSCRSTDDPTIIVALRRVMGLLRSLPIWAFLLTTQRPLHHVAPSLGARGRIPPFVSFMTDLGLTGQAPKALMKKPLGEYSTMQHISAMGRPLWQSLLKDMSVADAREFVLEKLLCGPRYQPAETVHLFEVLAYRVALDPVINRLEAVSLEEEAVQSHLRWITEVSESSGFVETISLEEPIVSEAATSLFCHRMPNITDPWIDTIREVYNKLCLPGIIDCDRTGELWWRIISLIARDDLSRGDNYGTMSSKDGNHMRFARTFLFTNYIEALFTDRISNMILNTPANLVSPTSEKPPSDVTPPDIDVRKNPTVRSLLGASFCNFNHWSSTGELLHEDTINDLLHQLFFNQAALQLAPTQPIWDALIPLYNGALDEPFDHPKVAVFLIQVKTRKAKADLDPSLSEAGYKKLFRDRLIVSILVDFGLPKSSIFNEPTYSPTVWAYRIEGHSQKTYRCLPRGLTNVVRNLLTADVDPLSVEKAVANHNMHSEHHSWKSRLDYTDIKIAIAGQKPHSDKKRKNPPKAVSRVDTSGFGEENIEEEEGIAVEPKKRIKKTETKKGKEGKEGEKGKKRKKGKRESKSAGKP